MMDRSRRIAVLGNQWETAYRFRGPLIQRFLSLGMAVHVVGPERDDSFRQFLESIGAVTHGIPMSRSGINPFRELRTLLCLTAVLRRIRPGYLFTYFAKPVVYGSIAGVLARVPKRFALIAGLGYAFPFRGEGMSVRRKMLSHFVGYLYRLSLGFNQRVFFQNPDDMKFFVDSGLVDRRSVIRINGTGVNLQEFRKSPPHTRPVTFVLAARLIEEKGIRLFSEASGILQKRGYEARCIVLGGLDDNPSAISRTEMMEWVDAGLVEWPGAVRDVRPWLEASSVYVLPSYYREGVPRSIQEAMAIGRAVITTDSPGCRETVEPGRNGFLVASRDVESLVEAMEHFLREREAIVAMGLESRKMAEERFDVDVINRQMLQVMGIPLGQ